MSKIEKKLSNIIDRLNAERKPEDSNSPELSELTETVKMIRRLKEPVMPEDDFIKKITHTVNTKASQTKTYPHMWFAGTAALLVMVMITALASPFFGANYVVYAMDKAFGKVSAYHGLIEITETNADGEQTLQSKREVWADREGRYYISELEGPQQGQVTANNGREKWQLRPAQKQAAIFPAFPDSYHFTFDLANELEDIKHAAKIKITGEETVSGIACTVLEIQPDGGLPYQIWVDKATDLPIQKQTSVHNAVQYRITYIELEVLEALPKALTVYRLPDGFSQIQTNPEQFVGNTEEAEQIAGFVPKQLYDVPAGYQRGAISVETDTKAIRFRFSADTKTVAILQKKAQSSLSPLSSAILGTVGGNMAEVLTQVEANITLFPDMSAANIRSIRWQMDGFEYAVIGNTSIEELNLFVAGLTGKHLQIPDKAGEFVPQVTVEIDLEAETNDQKSADAGHSPWKLDPAYVAQVFVSLKISPDGIEGDYPIPYDAVKISQNTGDSATAEVKHPTSPVRTVYLKKLIRQDPSGIWTVVGYDPQ